MTDSYAPDSHGGPPADADGARRGDDHVGADLLAWWADVDVDDENDVGDFLASVDLDRPVDPTIPGRAVLQRAHAHIVSCGICQARRSRTPHAVAALLADEASTAPADPARHAAIAAALIESGASQALTPAPPRAPRRRFFGLIAPGSGAGGRAGLALRPAGGLALVAAAAAVLSGALTLHGARSRTTYDSASATLAATTEARVDDAVSARSRAEASEDTAAAADAVVDEDVERAAAQAAPSGGAAGASAATASPAAAAPEAEAGTGSAATDAVPTEAPVLAAGPATDVAAQASAQATLASVVPTTSPTRVATTTPKTTARTTGNAARTTGNAAKAAAPPVPPVAAVPSPADRAPATTAAAAAAIATPSAEMSSALGAGAGSNAAQLGDLGAWSDPAALAQAARNAYQRVASPGTTAAGTTETGATGAVIATTTMPPPVVARCALPEDTLGWGAAVLHGRAVVVIVRPGPQVTTGVASTTAGPGQGAETAPQVVVLDAASCTPV